jgi:hypothetical protein
VSNKDMSRTLASAIMDFEQKNYPHYLVSEVDITSFNELEVSYKITICSKLDPKYKLLKSTKKIKISELIIEYRDKLIEEILK